MYLSELSKLIRVLNEIRKRIVTKNEELESLQAEHRRILSITQRYRKIEEISGKTFPQPQKELELQLEKIAEEIQDLRNKEEEQTRTIARSLTELKVNLSSPDPELVKDKAIFHLAEDEAETVIEFLKEIVDVRPQLEVVDVIFESSDIIVHKVDNVDEATDKLHTAIVTLRAFGKSMSGEATKEIIELAEYLDNSKYAKIWEELAVRGKMMTQETYLTMNATDETEKKRIRAFLSDLTKRVPAPIQSDGHSAYTLTPIGKLVRLQFRKTGPISAESSETNNNTVKNESMLQNMLNRWLQ